MASALQQSSLELARPRKRPSRFPSQPQGAVGAQRRRPKDVTDAGSSLQPAPRAPSFPSLPSDAAPRPGQRSLTRSLALQTPGLQHGGSETPLLLAKVLRLRPGLRGLLVKGKVRVRRSPEERRRHPECCPRALLCRHRPLLPGSWHPWHRTPGTEMRQCLPRFAAPSGSPPWLGSASASRTERDEAKTR